MKVGVENAIWWLRPVRIAHEGTALRSISCFCCMQLAGLWVSSISSALLSQPNSKRTPWCTSPKITLAVIEDWWLIIWWCHWPRDVTLSSCLVVKVRWRGRTHQVSDTLLELVVQQHLLLLAKRYLASIDKYRQLCSTTMLIQADSTLVRAQGVIEWYTNKLTCCRVRRLNKGLTHSSFKSSGVGLLMTRSECNNVRTTYSTRAVYKLVQQTVLPTAVAIITRL